jgi:hypothetical protein
MRRRSVHSVGYTQENAIMTRTMTRLTMTAIVMIGLIFAGLRATADPPDAADQKMQLPPGWTEDDMKAYLAAITPGPMHEVLRQGVGVWDCVNQNWLLPDAPPMVTRSVTTVTPVMDGRFVQVEVAGEMPGMPDYQGRGLFGYDNAAGQLVTTWIDNRSTGIMNGTGERSDDGATITWTYAVHCPIIDGPTSFKQIETVTGPNTKTLQMYMRDPKSGQEFRMMQTDMTRRSADAAAKPDGD